MLWYAACFLKERVRERRIRSRSDEEAPVQQSRQHRFRARLVSMCGTGEHHHLDCAVPSSPAVILGAVGKATKRIGLTNAVTVLSTFHRSGHLHIETIRSHSGRPRELREDHSLNRKLPKFQIGQDGDHAPVTSNIFHISRRGALACGR